MFQHRPSYNRAGTASGRAGSSWRKRARSVHRSQSRRPSHSRSSRGAEDAQVSEPNASKMILVAFSGGPGAAAITTLNGGRNALMKRLEKEFPNVVTQKNSTHATDIILIPDGVSRASPSKLATARPDVQVMQVGTFLDRVMGRPDLKETLGIRSANDPSVQKARRGPRSPSVGYRNARAQAIDRSSYYQERSHSSSPTRVHRAYRRRRY